MMLARNPYSQFLVAGQVAVARVRVSESSHSWNAPATTGSRKLCTLHLIALHWIAVPTLWTIQNSGKRGPGAAGLMPMLPWPRRTEWNRCGISGGAEHYF